MITKVKIEGFKSIQSETLDFKPLTILTGTNSSGKSSVIQAIQLFLKESDPANFIAMEELTRPFSAFSDIRNKFVNARQVAIEIEAFSFCSRVVLTGDEDQVTCEDVKHIYQYEPMRPGKHPELFYLAANRIGPQDVVSFSNRKVGLQGESIFSHFEKSKDQPLDPEMVKFEESATLAYQVAKWLSLVSETESEIKTDKLNTTEVKVSFDSEGLKNISPYNLGAGMSYLSKVLILCLMAKKGDLVIIENPEIHLHPKAQSMLGVFFSFIASKGIQLVLEAHCEHLINKICYQVYDEKISEGDVIIHYKPDVKTPFETLTIDENGEFNNTQGEVISFPKGFFDASLADLMGMR